MSRVSPKQLEKSGRTSTEPPFRCAATRFTRPIWTEIAVVGLAVMFAFVAGGLLLIGQIGFDPVIYGLLLPSWAGGVGF